MTNQLKILTMNLLEAGANNNPAGTWRERLPLVLDVLHAGADVIGLQEATSPQLEDVERALGKDYTLLPGPESGESRLPLVFARLRAIMGRRRHAPRPKQIAGELVVPPVLTGDAVAGMADEVIVAESGIGPVGKPSAVAPEPVESRAGRRAEHCALLFRTDRWERLDGGAFWISPRPEVAGSVLPGTVLPRVVNWVRLKERTTGRTGTFFNAHLDFLPWAPLRSARILRRVMDMHWDDQLQVLMGDFNAVPRSAAYRYFARALSQSPNPPLADAWLSAEERIGPEGTFHGGTGRVRWTGRLDRILFRPHIPVERVTTITHRNGEHFPSDHFPVLAEFRTG